MQDVGIMPGRHLKGALSFIWWDASSMRTEERGLPECHEPADVLFKGAFMHLFFLSFQFLSFPGCLSSHHSLWLFFYLSVKVCCPQEISSHIQRWQVNLSRNYNDNFTCDCFWFTDLHPRDWMHHVVCMCGVILHQEHKDSIKNDDLKELVNLNCAAVTAPKNQVCCREGK